MSVYKAGHDPLPETQLDKVDIFDLPAFGKHGVLDRRAVDVVKHPIDDTIVRYANQCARTGLDVLEGCRVYETTIKDFSRVLLMKQDQY